MVDKVGRKMILAAAVLALGVSVAFCQVQSSGEPPSFEDFYSQQTVHVYVDDKDGNDESCLLPGSKTPCQSLEHIARAVSNMSYISRLEVVVHSELELRDVIIFNSFPEIKLAGSQAQNNITCGPGINNNAGLIFISVQNVTIENLTFSRCGAFQNYTTVSTESKRQIRAAIHIVSPTNVAVTNVALMSNNGTGLFATNVRGGIVKISNSVFDRNEIEHQTEYGGGGGAFVWQWQYQEVANEFIFEDCYFSNNRAHATVIHNFITNIGSVIADSGRGGGIHILLTNLANSNKVSVLNCNFTGNVAFLGGGLGVYMRDNSQDNSVLVQSSTFERNGCQNEVRIGSGGGANFGFSFRNMNRSLLDVSYNQISIVNTTFKENCAEVGGGTTFFSSRSEYSNFNNSVVFSGCKWIANNARLGAAVDVHPHVLDRLTRGFFPTPVFMDCEFINNSVTVRTHDLHYTIGTGTFFSSLFDITFQSNVKFVNNSGSAFIIVNGIADFSSCNATFVDNTGLQGGAIALVGVSSMLVGPQCTYTFTQNRATDRGGAIYSYMTDEHDFFISKSCFIQYLDNLRQDLLIPVSNWTSTFIFKGNFAQRYGHSIFATSVVPCKLRLYGLFDFTSSGVFVFEDVDNQLATDGASFNITGTLPFRIIPGQEYILEVELIDDFDQRLDTPIRASILNEMENKLEVDDAFSCVTGNAIQLLGEEEVMGDLLLQSITTRQNSIIVNVTLQPCPTGFILSRSDRECVCDAHSYVGITHCNAEKFYAYLEDGFWIGYVKNEDNTSQLATSLCPEGFCGYGGDLIQNRSVRLPQSHLEIDENICGPVRRGILCGKCKPGFTVYYNSPKYRCKETGLCKMGWLFYILSELIPVTILFTVVLAFNISFTAGSINGFILFSQILDTFLIYGSGVIKTPDTVESISWGYSVFYGFFSLNFFGIEPLSFCLLRNAGVLDVLAFKYITIVYSFILIIGVIVFMRHCAPRMLGRHFKLSVVKNSVIHGLSTFVVVCYAQCINVSLNILLPQPLRGRGGHPLHPRRVWFNGEIEVFGNEHLPYAIPALFFLIIIGIILPFLLIGYPLVNKILAFCGIGESFTIISPCKRIHISKLKPFLDSFQGCFKDNFRFFAGLYFLYRWIGPLAYAASSVSLGGYYALVEAVLIVILVVHAVAQPYTIHWHNIVDVLLLGDLAIINGLTLLAYFYSRTDRALKSKKSIDIVVSIQLVFIYLPILFYVTAFILMMCYKFCFLKLRKLNSSRRTQSENEMEQSLTNSDQLNASTSVPLEEFPARLLGDDVEYEEFPSEFSHSPTPSATSTP